MRIAALSIALLFWLAFPPGAASQLTMPRMTSVEPTSGKAGDVLVVEGAMLDKDTVAALYLTDGKTDFRVSIVEQADTSIKFRIPPDLKPGRYALVVLTKGKEPKLIEEPVKVTVDADTR